MSRLAPVIHARGSARRLDAVLELVAFAARPCPLTTSLDELPRRIAGLFDADVCSIYLLEGDDLVMRGNVGFPSKMLGEVRLAVGEGITGMSVEAMRPISLEAAPSSKGFRNFPELEEEKFPFFLAVPVAGPAGPLGALVLQRRAPPPFSSTDLELAAALTVPIAAAAERAKVNDALRGDRRAHAGGTRRMTLAGRPVVAGRAIGAVSAFRRPTSRRERREPQSTPENEKALDRAIREARRTLAAFAERAGSTGVDPAVFARIGTILDDGRIRERALELSERAHDLAGALAAVGGEAARAAAMRGDAFGVERAAEIADVCEALSMLVATDRRAELPRGAVLVGSDVTLFDVFVTARSHPAAVVLSERAVGPLSRTLLTLFGVPAVVDVPGLFRWVSDGDIVLVDGDHALVRVNPSRAEISLVREAKKQAG